MQKILQDINIGANLRRLRKISNYSQNDVAAKMSILGRSISANHYSQIEQGRKNLFVSDLILFSKIFNVDFNEFFVGLELPNEDNFS